MRTSSLALLLLVACSTPPAPIDASSDARSDVEPDASPQPEDAGPPLPALPAPWRREPSFPTGVDHHATAIVETAAGAYLYVLGGMTADSSGRPLAIHDTIHRARIGDDGALGAWELERVLPAPLAFHMIATSGSTIVLAGGLSTRDDGSLGWIPFVMWSSVDHEGHVGPWQGLEAIATATLHGAAVIAGERLYLVGGGAGAASSHTAVRSLRIAGGVIDDARDEIALPAERSHHVLEVRDGHLYVAAGFAGPPAPATSVLRAPIGEGGVLGAWEDVGALAEPAWTASSIVSEDALVMIGGGIGEGPTDRIVRVAFDASGHVAPIEELAPLPYPRAHVHQTPSFGGRIYSVGGRRAEGLGQASSSDVYSAALDALASP
ncbi:hypothetical protein [Sandaracinus amylolyticus]|uniref:Uncharacterized protein n=1 Tax=Sandaracinus amylolyticus TaxID=927083 RepID=A0A0F6YGV0_9BACT|nr:hypothetical protein [Sandaracinus amylolyticus]AKF03285.1 hypothetical protein DB32_000434 [Sandaracinus amylolyticus]